MTHPFEAHRELFPILASKTQLSSCSQSAFGTPVAQALADYNAGWLERGMDWTGWMAEVGRAKAEFAKLINAAPEDIGVMSCVSDIASSVASALQFPAGKNRIVVGEIDFPSIGHVWLAQRGRGAAVDFVPADDGHCIGVEAYDAAIDERTALVSVSHVSYYNGFLQDIAAIAGLARAQDALLFVDAYQSVGSVCIDVQRDGIDILACGAQKFLLGCPGIAFVYVSRAVARRLAPANTGWFGRVNPFAFDIRGLDYADGAARFDTGTPPMVNAFAARAGMGILNTLDMAAVQAWLRHLSDVALAEAKSLGLCVVSPADLARKSATTAVHVGEAGPVEKRMAQAGFIVSARNDVIRIAPHFYNNEQDVITALRALKRITS